MECVKCYYRLFLLDGSGLTHFSFMLPLSSLLPPLSTWEPYSCLKSCPSVYREFMNSLKQRRANGGDEDDGEDADADADDEDQQPTPSKTTTKGKTKPIVVDEEDEVMEVTHQTKKRKLSTARTQSQSAAKSQPPSSTARSQSRSRTRTRSSGNADEAVPAPLSPTVIELLSDADSPRPSSRRTSSQPTEEPLPPSYDESINNAPAPKRSTRSASAVRTSSVSPVRRISPPLTRSRSPPSTQKRPTHAGVASSSSPSIPTRRDRSDRKTPSSRRIESHENEEKVEVTRPKSLSPSLSPSSPSPQRPSPATRRSVSSVASPTHPVTPKRTERTERKSHIRPRSHVAPPSPNGFDSTDENVASPVTGTVTASASITPSSNSRPRRLASASARQKIQGISQGFILDTSKVDGELVLDKSIPIERIGQIIGQQEKPTTEHKRAEEEKQQHRPRRRDDEMEDYEMAGHGEEKEDEKDENENENENENEDEDEENEDVEVISHTQVTPSQSSKKSSTTKHKPQSHRKSAQPSSAAAAAAATPSSLPSRSLSPSPSSDRPRRRAVAHSKLVSQLASEAAVSVDELRALFNDDGRVHAAEVRKRKRAPNQPTTTMATTTASATKSSTEDGQQEEEGEEGGEKAVVSITGTDVTPVASSASSSTAATATAKPADVKPPLTQPPKKNSKQLARMTKLQRMQYHQQVEAWEEHQRQLYPDGVPDQDEIGVAFIVSMKRNPDYGKRTKLGHSASLYQVRWDDGSETWEPESILADVPEVRRDWKRRSAITAWRQAHPCEYEIGGEEEEAAREEFEFISSIPGGIGHLYETDADAEDEDEIDAAIVNVLTSQVTSADRERIAAEHEARERIRKLQAQAEKREAKRLKREAAQGGDVGGGAGATPQSSVDIRATIQEALQQRKARRASNQTKTPKPKKQSGAGATATATATATAAAAAAPSPTSAIVLSTSQFVPIPFLQPPPLIPVVSEPFIPYEDDLFEDEFYDDDALHDEDEPEWTNSTQKRRRTSVSGAALAPKSRGRPPKRPSQASHRSTPAAAAAADILSMQTPGIQALHQLTQKWRWRLSMALVGLSPFPCVTQPPNANPTRWRTHLLLRAVLLEWTDVEMHRQVLKVNPWTYKSNAPETIDEAQQIALQSVLQASLQQVTVEATVATEASQAVDGAVSQTTNTADGDTTMTPAEGSTSTIAATDTPMVPSETVDTSTPVANDATMAATIETSEASSMPTSAVTTETTTAISTTTICEPPAVTVPPPATTAEEISTASIAPSSVSHEQAPILSPMVSPMDLDHDNQSDPVQTVIPSDSPVASNSDFTPSSSSATNSPNANPTSTSEFELPSSSSLVSRPLSTPTLTPEQLINAAVQRQLQMKPPV